MRMHIVGYSITQLSLPFNQSVFYVCSHRGDITFIRTPPPPPNFLFLLIFPQNYEQLIWQYYYYYYISNNISIIQNISYIVVSI